MTEKSFGELAKRLGKRQKRYSTFITADSYELSKKERMIGHLIMYNRYSEAEQLLAEMEKEGLEDTKENRQYLMTERVLVVWKMKKISREDGMKQLWEALRYTMSEKEIERFGESFLTRQETIILSNLANGYYKLGEKEKAIDILWKLRENYKNTGIRKCYHFKSLYAVLANLATYLEETGNYEEALKVCEEGIQLGLEADKGNIMQRFLTTRACVLEDMEKKEESIQEFTKAYYISLLYLDEHTAGLIREHLREKYEISL